MKILIIGATGLVGWYMWRHICRSRTHQAVGTYHQYRDVFGELPEQSLIRMDLGDLDNTKALILAIKPDMIVLAGGITHVDAIEDQKGQSWRINVEGTKAVVDAANQANCQKLVFISSDYVFDGKNGPYSESSLPNPINEYGRLKLLAEHYVLSAHEGLPLVIRTCGVFGSALKGVNFAQRLIDTVTEKGFKGPYQVVNDQFGTPTYAGDVVEAIMQYAEGSLSSRRKLLHVVGDSFCSRLEFAQLILEGYNNAFKELVQGIPTAEMNQRAIRPKRAGLISDVRALQPLDKSIQRFLRDCREPIP